MFNINYNINAHIAQNILKFIVLLLSLLQNETKCKHLGAIKKISIFHWKLFKIKLYGKIMIHKCALTDQNVFVLNKNEISAFYY